MCVSQGRMEMGDERWKCRGIVGEDVVKGCVKERKTKRRKDQLMTLLLTSH